MLSRYVKYAIFTRQPTNSDRKPVARQTLDATGYAGVRYRAPTPTPRSPNRPCADSPMHASPNANPRVLLIGFSATEQRELQARLHAHRLPVWSITDHELDRQLVAHGRLSVIVHRTSAASTFSLDWVEKIRAMPCAACRSVVLGFRTMPCTEGAGNHPVEQSRVLLDLPDWSGATRILAETGNVEFRTREILDAVSRARRVRQLINSITHTCALIETLRRCVSVTGASLSAPTIEGQWPLATRDGLTWREERAAVGDEGVGHERPSTRDRPAQTAQGTTGPGIARLLADADLRDAHFPYPPLTDWQWPVFLRIVGQTLRGQSTTLQALSAQVEVPDTSLWRFIERLKAEGLIVETQPQRRRLRRITATPRGIALTEAMTGAPY